MAQKPDGKPAKTERVTFTRPAAERIAKVVREVEAGDRDQPGLTFGNRITGSSGKTFRMATFTGAWAINSSRTVTFRNQTTTPNTVSATNLLLDMSSTAVTATRNCAIAKDGTAWYLVFPQAWTREVTLATGTAEQAVITGLETSTLTFLTSMPTANFSVISGISISATLNTTDCSISISQETQGTTVVVLSGAPQSTTATVLASAPETASIVVQTGTYTATIITLESP